MPAVVVYAGAVGSNTSRAQKWNRRYPAYWPRFLSGTIAAMAAKSIQWELKCKTCGKWSRLLFEPNRGPSIGGPRFVNCATAECRDGWDMVIPGNFISVAQSSRVG